MSNIFTDNFNLKKAHLDSMFGRDNIQKGGVGSGRHIGDMSKQEKHSLAEKMKIKGHESMTEKELDKHLSDKNVEKQIEEFRNRKSIEKAEYGGKGDFDLPTSHKAAIQVPKGGSSCSTCRFVDVENHACKNQYYVEWNGGKSKLPDLPLDEICSDWYEPKKGEIKKAEVNELQKAFEIFDIQKGGYGSGYRIGTTTTGKNIYNEPLHTHHNRFTSDEHEEAAKIHDNLAITEDEEGNKRKARNHRYIARVKNK